MFQNICVKTNIICTIHKYREPLGKYTSAHCPRVQLNSSKGLQKYHCYSDSPSQNITVLTEKSGKDWRAMAQIFQWVGVILDLLVGASEEELSEHDPEDQDD